MPEDMAVLIAQAVEKAVQSLRDEITSLKEKTVALEATQATLSDNQLIQLRLTNDMKEAVKKNPQPMQKDRADILRALLVANGGKMLAKDIRKRMHIKKNHFAELLRVCDFIDTKPFHLDRRQTVIILKSELVLRD